MRGGLFAVPRREFKTLRGVPLGTLYLMREECVEELKLAAPARRIKAAQRNGLTKIRAEISQRVQEIDGQEAGLTPPADSGLAGNPVANTEAPAVSREVGQA